MLDLITDSHIAMGGTMDPWPDKIHNAIVWLIVAMFVLYLTKRLILAWRASFPYGFKYQMREGWRRYQAGMPTLFEEMAEREVKKPDIVFDMKLVLKETNPKRSLIIPTNPKQMRPVEGK